MFLDIRPFSATHNDQVTTTRVEKRNREQVELREFLLQFGPETLVCQVADCLQCKTYSAMILPGHFVCGCETWSLISATNISYSYRESFNSRSFCTTITPSIDHINAHVQLKSYSGQRTSNDNIKTGLKDNGSAPTGRICVRKVASAGRSRVNCYCLRVP